MKSGLTHGAEDGDHNDVGFVEIESVFVILCERVLLRTTRREYDKAS